MVYRYLFWQEEGGFLRRISLATHKNLPLDMRVRDYSTIKLDCVNKQVYSFARKFGNGFNIYASDYDGGNQRMITSGQFWDYILGVFNGSLYFMNNDKSYVKEMNLSSRNYIRSIEVEYYHYYRDLIVVHQSLQPLGKL